VIVCECARVCDNVFVCLDDVYAVFGRMCVKSMQSGTGGGNLAR